jgi:hypothetical protein
VQPSQAVLWDPAARVRVELPVGKQERGLDRPGPQGCLLRGIKLNGQCWPAQHRPEHRARPLRQVVHPAVMYDEATQVVDLFHAREHLHDLACKLEFMLLDRKEEWLAARLDDLDYGDIDGICKAARVFPLAGVKKDELDTALGYFENNAPRMRYHWFRQCGLFVGSGLVESGCKAVIGQRLKLSGMRWTVAGAGAITTLRCQQASRPEDRIWPAPHNQTPAA